MGARGKFSEKVFRFTGKIINNISVIEKQKGSASIPRMSKNPNDVYILKSKKGYKSIGIYNQYNELYAEINIDHPHKDIPRGIAHIHFIFGGRANNVRMLTKKEIKKYGKTIEQMGGKVK